MRRLATSLGAIAILLGANAAEAGTLTSATWLQVTHGVPMNRTTAQLGATGSSTSGSISVNLSYPAFSTEFITTAATTFFPFVTMVHVKITQGGTQAITATPSMATGTPNIPGTVILMTAPHVANVSTFVPGMFTIVRVPLGNGQVGSFSSSFAPLGLLHFLRVDFYGWTPATLTLAGLTSDGAALPNVVAMGSFNLSGNGGGTVTLVSPSKISIDGVVLQQRTATFTTLKLSFVPEPGTALLLGAAAAALAIARQRYGNTR